MQTEHLTQMFKELQAVGGPVESNEDWEKRIADEEFQKKYKAAQEWSVANSDVCRLHEIAIEDYIAGRYAVLQLGLFSTGFALCAQAVEKLLKCYLLLAGYSWSEMKKISHGIVILLDNAQKTSGQQDLANFLPFCQSLEKWYNSRYPGQRNTATQWMRNAVPDVDHMVCYLEECLPLPAVVAHFRYGGGDHGHQWCSVFVRLFNAMAYQHKLALLHENASLIQRLPEFESRFKADRLMAMLPAATAEEFAENSSRKDAIERKFLK